MTIKAAYEYLGSDVSFTEIAFFGGSFTAINREYMIALLDAAYTGIKKYGFAGIRCSTRPDAIDCERLELLKRYNTTAIELGAQSMDNNVLELNHRGHTAEDVIKSSELIKSYGFELGLQMMTGLYGSDDNKDRDTAEKIILLNPSTVRIYPTITLENTELADLYREGKYFPPSLDEAVSLCAELIQKFENANIRIIRVGLHATDEIINNRVAGPYHPAFKELCMSKIMFDNFTNDVKSYKSKSFIVKVNPKCISAFIGQKKQNMNKFRELGLSVRVIPDEQTDVFTILSEGI
jgi:histone acetyltransferase (RNA polymerase elongator complex component)